MAVLFPVTLEISIKFSVVPDPIYTQTSSLQKFPFCHILANIFLSCDLLIIAILMRMRCHLMVGLICISLIMNDIEDICTHLLAILVSSLKNCLSGSFASLFTASHAGHIHILFLFL